MTKVWLNYLLDRIIDLANMVLMDAYSFPWPKAQTLARAIARYVGDLSWFLRDFPRLSAYKLAGPKWIIIFVGSEESLNEIRYLFFEEEIYPQTLGRVAVSRLSAQTEQWLAGGADLVIWEQSRIYSQQPKSPIQLVVPSWINQILALPEPLEDLLSGRDMKSVRHNLNRAKKADFSWYFSRSKEDFDHFHYNMYLPFIKERHEDRALVAAYQDQWSRWFIRGGLVVITQNQDRVGGLLCYRQGKTCFAVEVGVLNADPGLIEQGIKISADWFAINWAYEQGARIYDMGGSRPWRSDGVFTNKSRWRTKVVQRKRIYSFWTFMAQDLCSSLQDHINRLGFISEIDGKFYATLLDTNTGSISDVELDKERSIAEKQGLDGLVVVSANAQPVIYNSVD